MSKPAPDIASIIFAFAERLPATVSTDILVFVLIYIGNDLDFIGAGKEAFLPMLKASLAQDGLKQMGAVLRSIAAFDHVLWRAVKTGPTAKISMQRVADILPSEFVERDAASRPLRDKHFEKALAGWTRLRSTLITADNLVDYEDSLLLPRGLARLGKDRPQS